MESSRSEPETPEAGPTNMSTIQEIIARRYAPLTPEQLAAKIAMIEWLLWNSPKPPEAPNAIDFWIKKAEPDEPIVVNA